jgi:hypothetical protein
MKRRSLLGGMAAGAISTLDWLRFFRSFGVPGSSKDLGIAQAVAQTAVTPRYLIYWFQEGGWDGYSMFNPVLTENDATRAIAAGTLYPSPSWSAHRYRPTNWGTAPVNLPRVSPGGLTYGYLAEEGVSLFPDMAVVSSHEGSTFHSGARWDYHYGKYSRTLTAMRAADERSVLQAFCEAYGSSYLLPHISWHRWMSDGELSLPDYPEGSGYYEKLGPAHAHTIYGRTPADMRARLASFGTLTGNVRDARIRAFTDNLHNNFIADKNAESVTAFASAVQIHRQLVSGNGPVVDPTTMFTGEVRSYFGVTDADEQMNFTSVNDQPARSKETPNTNAQAMMTYELMTKGLSCGFWIENRQIRGFDTHKNRSSVMSQKGQTDQRSRISTNLWQPLQKLAARLKSTPHAAGGSYWDYTTIVLCSEMGRTLHGDVQSILSSADTDANKYIGIMDQDVCQHWKTSSVAFLGGTVAGNRQWGKVGRTSLESIPILATGQLDPAYDPDTGLLKAGATKSTSSFVPNAGHVYATALSLTGLSPTGKGRNTMPALSFIKR